MKRTLQPWIARTVAAVLVGAPLTAFIAQARAADVDPPPASRTTTATSATLPAATSATQPDRTSSSVVLIQRADSPSAAVDAYARAAAAEGGTAGVTAQAAYVRKMVD